MKVVGYLRVSTDDKGQNPERQADVIKSFAARTGMEVVSWHTDEGVSGAVDPFQRQGFLEAVQDAKEAGATAIVVESVDRLTREGTRGLAMTEFFLELDHGLRLEMADLPPGMDQFAREIITSLMATCAKEFRRRLREQIRTGIERAKRNGFPNGRPGRKPKADLTPAERNLVHELVTARKMGLDKVALEVSRARGAFEVADPNSRRERAVGPTWMDKQVRKAADFDPKMAEVRGRLSARRRGGTAPKEPEKEPTSPVGGAP